MKFTVLHLSQIPIEEAHGGSGARQMLIKPEFLTTPHLEAITKGYLSVGKMFDWHNHIETDEIFIVTQGNGKFYYKEQEREHFFDYKPDDVIIAPANLFHKIVAEGTEETQGFFFRIKTKQGVIHNRTFIQKNIKDVPLEAIHTVKDTRKTLVTVDMVASDYLEAITKGILRSGDTWEIHEHIDTDEVGIVLKGQGVWVIEGQEVPYTAGTIVIVQGNVLHTQRAQGDTPTEFFFIRVKVA
ncbi:MAG: cupin domain-containing protein [Patescibacteria group bacterium]|nr:cupin domain-containing protein [Patescibacteria group bacterium]MDE2588686.1 cupin domain-containing protein [Patescibacteria group bacterium]